MSDLTTAKRTALLELWGLGDGVMMTGALKALADSGRRVTVICSGGTRALLAPSFEDVEFIVYEAPWKAFRGKYRIWQWDWGKLRAFVGSLRRGRFDEIVSVRRDPRDHLLMWLSGAGRRFGFGRLGSGLLLSEEQPAVELRHKVDDWSALAAAVTGGAPAPCEPGLSVGSYPGVEVPEVYRAGVPVVVLHCGARIPVRRWKTAYFRELIARMRGLFDFKLVLMPDPDGYGSDLEDVADLVCGKISLDELVVFLGRGTVLVANDSAPAHIAAATGVPSLTFFGPTSPEMFRPYGADHRVVIRDLCEHRPCFDYCKFDEPYCLTRLTVDEVWEECREFLEPLLGGAGGGE